MTSWKTTLGGAFTAASVIFTGSVGGMALFSKFGSHALEVYVEAHIGVFFWMFFIGIVCSAAGAFCTALFSRDNNVTSEQVKADQPKDLTSP